MTQLDTKQNKIKEQMEKLLLELVEKRGKHSKLWMYPKSESLKEAVDQLYSLYQEGYTPDELIKIFHKSPYSSGHTLQFLKWLNKQNEK